MKKSLSAVALIATLVGLAAVPANAAITPTLSKSTDLLNAGETITVSIPDIPAGEGVYVRLCKAPATTGARPTLCYTPEGNTMGAGTWASLDAANIASGAAVDAAQPIPLKVKGQFTASGTNVDCTVDSCIVFIRRDHVNGSDTSLDANVPVKFATGLDQTIAPKIEARVYKKFVNANAKKNIAALGLTTVQGNALTWTSLTPSKCKVSDGTKYTSIKFKKKGTCKVTATATATIDYKATVFTWTYKVK